MQANDCGNLSPWSRLVPEKLESLLKATNDVLVRTADGEQRCSTPRIMCITT